MRVSELLNPRALAGCVMIALTLMLSACGDRDYSQKSPDDVLRTAKLMVERGEARKLSALFYAENDDMRKVLHNVGVLLGNLQRLGQAVSEGFPKDVTQLKARAEAAAKSGKSTSFLSQIASQASGASGRNRRSTKDPEKARKEMAQRQEQFADALNMLFADPYGFLGANASKLSTTPLADDMAAVLWDGQPVLPPLGMVMRKSSDDKWYIVLPLNIPGLPNYLPQNPQEYKVFGALVAIINNVIVDLARDVREKKITDIDDLSRKAGEKVFIPAAMGYVAYSKMIEDRRKKASSPTTATAPAEKPKPTPPGPIRVPAAPR